MMENMNCSTIPFPLYHGTSTLFLSGIVEFGLGGANPIADLRLLEFARKLYPLVQQHLAPLDDYMVKVGSFESMVEQKSSAMNFQHGQAYLSPSRETAVRYAANNPYGSELLSTTLELLRGLVRLDVPGIRDALYQEYPQIFAKLDISAAPILVRVDDVPSDALLTEGGHDPSKSIDMLTNLIASDRDVYQAMSQQTNFRLTRPMAAEQLRFWLIDVRKWHVAFPKYALYSVSATADT